MLVAQARWDFPVLERQGHLDQTRHAGCGVGVADVGLDRTDAAKGVVGRAFPKRLGEGGDFDRVAQVGAGAVAFHVVDGVGAHASHRLRLGDGLGLSVHAGGQVTSLGGAVVVDRGALDHGPDVVAVFLGVLQATQHHGACARAEHRALRAVVESVAVAVGREDFAFLKDVAACVRQLNGHAPGQGHVAFTAQERLAGIVHRHQRGGAGGLDVDAGALEVKDVADPGGEKVLVVAGVAQQEHAGAGDQIRVGADVEIEVAAHAATGIDRDRAGERLGRMTSTLQRFPGHLQKLAVLRIHDGRFLGAEAEEIGIKLLKTIQHGSGRHVVAVPHAFGAFACCQQVRLTEAPDRLDAVAQVGPVGLRVSRAGQVGRQAHNGDVVLG